MQIKKLETLIDDMDLLIFTKEVDLEYIRAAKARLTLNDDKQNKEKIDNIDQVLPQKEEELNGLKFVTERYVIRLTKERSANGETEKSS